MEEFDESGVWQEAMGFGAIKCFSRPMEEEVESIVARHWHSTEECTETLGAQVSSACPLWSFTLGRVQPLGQSRRVAMDT